MADAGRHDQRVIANQTAVRHPHLAGVRIEGHGLAEEDGRVRPLAEDRAQGLRDLARTESPRSDLVEQRLEQVEVAAVDERHIDSIVATQVAGGIEATEPAADDEDAMPGGGRGGSLKGFRRAGFHRVTIGGRPDLCRGLSARSHGSARDDMRPKLGKETGHRCRAEQAEDAARHDRHLGPD